MTPYWLLACYAAYFGLAKSTIPGLKHIRHWVENRSSTVYEMTHCPMCAGFWASFAVALGAPPAGWFPPTAALAGASAIYLTEAVLRHLDPDHQ